jgi:predicted hotdog family 3-hydroxylacyl-ACP dehydratase
LAILHKNILSLIPQRQPFVMVDQLLSCNETTCTTIFKVIDGNVLVGNGDLSEAGLLENIAQTAAAGAGLRALQSNAPVLAGYIGAIKNFEVFELPKIGDVIETDIVIQQQIFDITLIAGSVKCGGHLIAKCEMKIFIKAN